MIDKNNLALVRQSFASTALSHKVHEMAVVRKERKSKLFKILNIFLVSCVLVLLVLQANTNKSHVYSIAAAGLTALEMVLLITSLAFNVEGEIVAHKNSALKYMSLRERYKVLIGDIISERISAKAATSVRNEYLREYQNISDLAVQTDENDYSKAMSKLKIVEDDKNVWSDKQIDNLLPKELRVK